MWDLEKLPPLAKASWKVKLETWRFCLIGIAVATLSQTKREVIGYGDNSDSSVSYQSSPLSETGHEDTASREALVLIQTRITLGAVAFWWHSLVDFAQKMLVEGVKKR
jgi:hypothetical protein